MTAVLQRASGLRLRGATVAALVGIALFVISYNGGSYSLDSYTTLAIVVWWLLAIVLAFDVFGPLRVTRLTVVGGGALAAYVGWSLASTDWAPSAERALATADRALLYLGVYLFVSIAFAPRYAARWCDGIALGIAAIGVVALGTRFFPSVFHTSSAYARLPPSESRLSAPIGYWNGLAAFCALALPLLVRSALTKSSSVVRGLWLVPFPALVVTVYLTSSRGGAVTAALGLVVLILLVDRRVEALGPIVCAGLASAVAVDLVARHKQLVNTPLTAPSASRHTGALVVFVACVAAGVAYGGATALLRGRLRVPPRLQWAPVAAVVVAVVAGVAVSSPLQRLQSFKQLPTNLSLGSNYIQNHLFSSSGNGRWQLWTAALHQFRANPVLGGGAGSYGEYWMQHRPFGLYVIDAHSLYLQTLGELGIVGLLLLLVFLVAPLWAAGTWLARRPRGDERVAMAALTATLLAYLFAAAIDWVWELPAVTLAAIVVIAILCCTVGPPHESSARPAVLLRVGAVVLALAVLFCQVVPLLTDRLVARSQSAEGQDNLGGAVDSALQARSLAPWAASPVLQLALLAEETGQLDAARVWIQRAIDRDTGAWSYWLVAARIDTERGRIGEAARDLANARRLNPIGVAQLGPE